MSFDYADIAATASEILAEFGQTVSFRNLTLGTYDPETGLTTIPPSAVTTPFGVLLDFAQGQTVGPGGLIQLNDKRLLLEPNVVIPDMEDHLLIGTQEYIVKGIGEVNPAGTPVLYDLHLRS